MTSARRVRGVLRHGPKVLPASGGRLILALMRLHLRRLLLAPNLLLALTACSSPQYPLSDHFDGQKFHNPSVRADKTFGQFLKWQFSGGKKSWPPELENRAKPDLPASVAPGALHATFVNHATILLQFASLTVITDPVFSERVSPLSFVGPKRFRPPGVAFDALPKIDVVLVSHSHYDHMDLPTLKRLKESFDPLFIVPLGNRRHLARVGIEKIVELDWWQLHEIKPGVAVKAVPAQHWSARSPFDKNESLWSGFVISSDGLKAFFAGDTGYGPHFKEILAREGAMDASFLPIGSYEPRWFMKEQHMNPDDAVLAHVDLQSAKSVGIHFGCFHLANEGHEEPVSELRAALLARNVASKEFIAPDTGETMIFRK